jgi:hypothetical protein
MRGREYRNNRRFLGKLHRKRNVDNGFHQTGKCGKGKSILDSIPIFLSSIFLSGGASWGEILSPAGFLNHSFTGIEIEMPAGARHGMAFAVSAAVLAKLKGKSSE